ncbi:hypothetical protein DF186_18890, partial [Enterococcus hirae]
MYFLNLLCKVSDMKLNLDKFKDVCFKSVFNNYKVIQVGVLFIKFVNNLDKYLGVNLNYSRVFRAVCLEAMEKIKSRMS